MYNTVFKRLLDLGDFIGIEGFVFRTQMGEISIHAKRLTVLSKSIKPLPIVKYKDGVAYDKFEDPELRYRQRYVDLAVNEEIKISSSSAVKYIALCANISTQRLYGSGNPDSAIHCRRSSRTSIHNSPQRTGYAAVHAYCQ